MYCSINMVYCKSLIFCCAFCRFCVISTVPDIPLNVDVYTTEELTPAVSSSFQQTIANLREEMNFNFTQFVNINSLSKDSLSIIASNCLDSYNELADVNKQLANLKNVIHVHQDGCRRRSSVSIPIFDRKLEVEKHLLQVIADLRDHYKFFNQPTAIIYNSKVDPSIIQSIVKIVTMDVSSRQSTAQPVVTMVMLDLSKPVRFKNAMEQVFRQRAVSTYLVLDGHDQSTSKNVISAFQNNKNTVKRAKWAFMQLFSKADQEYSPKNVGKLNEHSVAVVYHKMDTKCQSQDKNQLQCMLQWILERINANKTKCVFCDISSDDWAQGSCTCSQGFQIKIIVNVSPVYNNQIQAQQDHIANWTLATGLPESKFFSANYFQNREVSIVTFPAPPYVYKKIINGKVKWTGLIFDILTQLSGKLNFSMSIREVENNESPFEKAIDVVSQQQVEIGALPFLLSEERLRKVNFTDPFDNNLISFMTYRPDSSFGDFIFLEPFTYSTWLGIAAMVSLMGPILFGIHRCSYYYKINGQSTKSRGLCSFGNCSWYIFGAMVNQGGVHLPVADSGRMAVAFWWIFQIITVTTYSGNLVAFLTFPKQENMFDSLSNLKASNLKWASIKHSSIEFLGAQAKEGILKEIYKNSKFYDKNEESEAISKVKVKTEVLFWNRAQLLIEQANDYHRNGHCVLDVSKTVLSENPLALVVPVHSEGLSQLNIEIRKMLQGGLVDKWKRKYWPGENACTMKQLIDGDSNRTVTLSQIYGSFYVLAIGFSAAIIMLFIELACKLYRNEHNRVHSINLRQEMVQERISRRQF